MNALNIENAQESYMRFIVTFIVGAMLAAVAQIIFERFFTAQANRRYALMAAAVLLTVAYYFILAPLSVYNIEFPIKTSVILFALLIAFIWIPTINNSLAFHQNLLAVIKAIFTSMLFAAILTLGFLAIYSAIDNLLFRLDDRVISHLVNIIWILFAPIYALSLIPTYRTDADTHAFSVPRFFEVLLTNIIIPLTLIYTLILIAYILINITGQFWSDNLLEPLLVSYAIISLIVYLLSFNLSNKYLIIYRRWFPKILLPIVLFQTIASILRIQEVGLTHGRYFVILFGVFSTLAAVIFSFNKEKWHGLSAVILLILSVISIVPPLDAFTLSRTGHMNRLEAVLESNEMLVGDQVVAKNNISGEDKVLITELVSYIDQMGYPNHFLPDDFDLYRDFDDVFGFDRAYDLSAFEMDMTQENAFWDWAEHPSINIEGFDTFLPLYIYTQDEADEALDPIIFEHADAIYHIEQTFNNNDYLQLAIVDPSGQTLLTYDTQVLFDTIFGEDYVQDPLGNVLTPEAATFVVENDEIRLQIVVMYLSRTEDYEDGGVYLLVEFK